MRSTRGFLLFCCTAGLIFGQAAPQKQLTARELFYAAAQAPAAAKPATARPPAKRSTSTPAKPVEIAPADTRPPAPHPTEAQVAQTVAPRPAPTTTPMPASGAPPLGLHYTVINLADDNTPTEVPNDTVFHAGDHIQFSVEANAPGYLYIVNQGTSGNWKPMFPSAEIEDGNNRIEGWHPYTMPPGSRLTFDSTVGTENLFIVLSLQPESDLESMIYSLQGKKKAAASPAQEAPEAPVQSSKELIVASNISNTDVDRMRTVYARDL